jgi:hypothetical protein
MAPTGLRFKDKLHHNRQDGAQQARPLGDKGAAASEGLIAEGSISDGGLVKDETEERLERLLFGDDAGFIEGLKARPASGQLIIRSDQGGEAADGGFEGDEHLESIADENVR